jgi:hypothetical protein
MNNAAKEISQKIQQSNIYLKMQKPWESYFKIAGYGICSEDIDNEALPRNTIYSPYFMGYCSNNNWN